MRDENLVQAWIAVLAYLCVIIAALWHGGISVNLGARGLFLFWSAAGCLVVSLRVRPKTTWINRAMLFAHGTLLSSGIGLCGALTTYWVMSVTNVPFADAALYRADLMLGLDWRAMYAGYLEMDWLRPILQQSYMAIFHTPALVLLALAATGQAERIKLMLVATAASLTITMLIFPFFPSKTAVIYLIGPNPPYIPVTGLSGVDIINDLRAGRLHEIQIHKMFGLVSFPSFHAAWAVLLSWACWTIRGLRWPIVLINAAMLIATPLEGAHYFVDIIAGIWVAVAASTSRAGSSQPNFWSGSAPGGRPPPPTFQPRADRTP